MNSHRALPWLVALAAIIAGPRLTSAQETQVPFDVAGKILVITPDLESSLHLFSTYTDFLEATLYSIADTGYILEVRYAANNRTLKDRVSRSRSDIEALRRDITARLNQNRPEVLLNQEGRVTLIISSSALALGFWGWAAPVALGAANSDNGQAFVGLYMITAATGILYPWLGTKDAEVTNAEASLAATGGYLGIVHGAMLASLFGIDLFDGGSSAFQSTCGISLLVSAGEMGAGYAIARSAAMSAGRASVIGTGATLGTLHGLGLAYLLADHPSLSAVGGLGLIGATAGALGSNALTLHNDFSAGDATVMWTTSMVGTYALWLNALALSNGDLSTSANVGTAMLGNLAGYGIGYVLVKDRNISSGDGTLVGLGSVAGGLLGAGLAYLVSGSNNSNGSVYSLMSTAGMIGGFALAYTSAVGHVNTDHSMWNINVNPLGITQAMSNRPGGAPILTIDGRW